MRFKIDTGADVTVIPESVFKRIRNANLMHSDRILCGPARNALHVIGQFNATLKHRGGVTSEEVYVVRGLQTPLIGLPAIKALGLVVRVCATESGDYATRILNSYPDLFTGLGTLGEEYKIIMSKATCTTFCTLYSTESCPPTHECCERRVRENGRVVSD